jgi:hypothetical protein
VCRCAEENVMASEIVGIGGLNVFSFSYLE